MPLGLSSEELHHATIVEKARDTHDEWHEAPGEGLGSVLAFPFGRGAIRPREWKHGGRGGSETWWEPVERRVLAEVARRWLHEEAAGEEQRCHQ